MRAFWNIEPNYRVVMVLENLVENWSQYRGYNTPEPTDELLKVLQRLKENAPVPEIEAIRPNADGKDFETLAKAVRESIERNEPEVGLDRLHTFLVKYFRSLCERHGISTDKDKPLHSLVGEYIKKIKEKGFIESDITERILKSTISVMEAFNRIRNNHSFAHDNEVLNYNESLLIFGHVTSSIRFIETIEAKTKSVQTVISEDVPF